MEICVSGGKLSQSARACSVGGESRGRRRFWRSKTRISGGDGDHNSSAGRRGGGAGCGWKVVATVEDVNDLDFDEDEIGARWRGTGYEGASG